MSGSKRKAETELLRPTDSVAEEMVPLNTPTVLEIEQLASRLNPFHLHLKWIDPPTCLCVALKHACICNGPDPVVRRAIVTFSESPDQFVRMMWSLSREIIPPRLVAVGLKLREFDRWAAIQSVRERQIIITILTFCLRTLRVKQRYQFVSWGMTLHAAAQTMTLADLNRWHAVYPIRYFNGAASKLDLYVLLQASALPIDGIHTPRIDASAVFAFLANRLHEERTVQLASVDIVCTTLVAVTTTLYRGIAERDRDLAERDRYLAEHDRDLPRRLTLCVPLQRKHATSLTQTIFKRIKKLFMSVTQDCARVPWNEEVEIYRTTRVFACNVLGNDVLAVLIKQLAHVRYTALLAMFVRGRYLPALAVDQLTLSYLGGEDVRIPPFASLEIHHRDKSLEAKLIAQIVSSDAPIPLNDVHLDAEPLLWASLFLSVYTTDQRVALANPHTHVDDIMSIRRHAHSVYKKLRERAGEDGLKAFCALHSKPNLIV